MRQCDRKGSNPPAPGNRPAPPPNPPSIGGSQCGWRPIEKAPKYNGPIYIWDDHLLMEVVWHQIDGTWQWCEFIQDKDLGDSYYYIPQPKFYLHVTPPPED